MRCCSLILIFILATLCFADPLTTNTFIFCELSSVPYIVPVTCTVAVTSTSVPTGTVTLSAAPGTLGSFSPSSCTLDSNGRCKTVFTPAGATTAGNTITFTANYALQSGFAASSASTQVTFTAVSTSVTATCSPATGAPSNQVTCTANVFAPISTSITVAGTVNFAIQNGVGSLGASSCNLVSGSCSVTFTPASNAPVVVPITISYAGTSSYLASSTIVQFGVSYTSLLLSCNPPILAAISPSICTVVVTARQAIPSSATIIFGDNSAGGSFSGTCTLSASGNCSTTYTPALVAAGTTVTITATYPGNANFGGSSSSVSLIVNSVSTTTSVACSPSTVNFNVATTCTATVSASATTSGTVSFFSGGIGSFSSQTCTISAGACSVTFTSNSIFASSVPIYAVYTGTTSFAPSFAATQLQISSISTSTSVSCPASAQYFTPIVCTVTVTGTTTPQGYVTYSANSNGVFVPRTCLLSGAGTCTVSFTRFEASGATTIQIAASFVGNAAFAASTSSNQPVNIQAATTTTQVDCSPSNVPFNALTSCTVTVSALNVVPSGTVTITSSLGAGPLIDPSTCSLVNGNCVFTFVPNSLPSTLTITATFNANSFFATSAGSFSPLVRRADTFTTITCGSLPATIAYNTPIACTITVQSPNATPTGSVFLEADFGSFAAPSCTLASGQCSVNYNPSPVTSGLKPFLVAYFAGSANFLPSSGYVGEQFSVINRATTSLSVSCPSSTFYNTQITCTVSFTGGPDASSATVYLTDALFGGNFSPASCTTFPCTVQYTPNTAISGVSVTINAYYIGSPFSLPATSQATFSVNPRSTTTAVSCTSTATDFNVLRTCTATLSSTANVGTGVVHFSAPSGSFVPKDCIIVPTTQACQVVYYPSPIAVGNQVTITADYAANIAFQASSGNTPNTVGPGATTTTVNCVPASTNNNLIVACTATVKPNNPGPIPLGQVAFTSGSGGTFTPATCTLNAGKCIVSYAPANPFVGTVTITATFAANNPYATSNGNFNLGVNNAATTTIVSCQPNPQAFDSTVNCQVSVTSIRAIPSGTVNLAVGAGTVPSSCTLDASGKCTFSYTGVQSAANTVVTIQANYAGASGFAASLNSTKQSVTAAATTTTVNCVPAVSSSTAFNVPNTCTATVTASAAVTLAGTVKFNTTSQIAGFTYAPTTATCTLASGSCSITFTAVPEAVGKNLIVTAIFTGSGVTPSVLSSVGTFQLPITRADTATAVVCPTTVANVATTCTATITTYNSAVVPVGEVYFSSTAGIFNPIFCQVSSTGICSVSYTPTQAAGTSIQVTAAYLRNFFYASSSGVVTVTSTAVATTTTIQCAKTQTPYNIAVSCIAIVTSVDSTVPSGTVSFSGGAGSFTPPTCTLNSFGRCATQYTPSSTDVQSTPTPITLTGTYTPAINYLTSNGNLNLLVQPAVTITTVTCPAPAAFTVPVTCTVTITTTGSPITVTNAVTFNNNGGSFTTCTLSSNTCNVVYTPIQSQASNTIAITANLASSQTVAASSGTYQLGILVAPTVLAVSCAASTGYNIPVTCTGTVSVPSFTFNTFSGSITFLTPTGTGAFSPNTCNVGNTGSCSVSFRATAAAASTTFQINGTYIGTSQFAVSSALTTPYTVSPAQTTTTVNCIPSSIGYNLQLTCTATVTAINVIPSGQITFSAPSGSFANTLCNLDITGKCAVTYIPVIASSGQTVLVTATLTANPRFQTSSGSFTETINNLNTNSYLNCSSDATNFNVAVTCTAVVVAPNNAIPLGTITLTAPSGTFTPPSPCTLTSGVCTFSYLPVSSAVGSVALQFTFNPASANNGFITSTSNVFNLAVTKALTTTTVNCVAVPNPTYNSAVTCTASAQETATTTAITTGSFNFYSYSAVGSPIVGSCTLSGSSSCTLSFTPSFVTSNSAVTIAASYVETAIYFKSVSTSTFTVQNQATTTTITCTPASVVFNSQVTCTATTVSQFGSVPATGLITFSASPGTFLPSGPPTCDLVRGSCSLKYLPTAASAGTSVTIAATFTGTPPFKTSTGSFNLGVTAANVIVRVSCSPATPQISQTVPCTATVLDSGLNNAVPSGTVNFLVTSGAGNVVTSSCSLTNGKCSVNFSSATAGKNTIQATYQATSSYNTGSATTTVVVIA